MTSPMAERAGSTSLQNTSLPLQQGSRPLAGITIAVDAGHGGSDPGAVGVPGTKAAMEKDINLATAIAVQKRLESLGATVLMTRAEDDEPADQ